MGARSRLITSVAALAVALGIGACGGGDDFVNDPRPAAPIALSALITDRGIRVSPATVGAGPATFTVSNQSSEPGALILEGPTDAASAQIQPGGTAGLQTELVEGEYTVASGEDSTVREGSLTVGAERPSAQNELLLP
jgi:hypothetical protein